MYVKVPELCLVEYRYSLVASGTKGGTWQGQRPWGE